MDQNWKSDVQRGGEIKPVSKVLKICWVIFLSLILSLSHELFPLTYLYELLKSLKEPAHFEKLSSCRMGDGETFFFLFQRRLWHSEESPHMTHQLFLRKRPSASSSCQSVPENLFLFTPRRSPRQLVWFRLVLEIGFVSNLFFFYSVYSSHVQSRLHRHLLTTLRFL